MIPTSSKASGPYENPAAAPDQAYVVPLAIIPPVEQFARMGVFEVKPDPEIGKGRTL